MVKKSEQIYPKPGRPVTLEGHCRSLQWPAHLFCTFVIVKSILLFHINV